MANEFVLSEVSMFAIESAEPRGVAMGEVESCIDPLPVLVCFQRVGIYLQLL
jgi:hypothetical protein